MPLPRYYTGLDDCREVFRLGYPILTYHKLGPRPRGVRLKGLYLSGALFRAQLRELQREGWTSGSLDELVLTTPEIKPQRIVITFDDGYTNVLRHGLAPLQETGFRAIQFLVADFLGCRNEWDIAAGEQPEPLMDAVQVKEWLVRGHQIGAHSCTHPFLTRVDAARAWEEISASRKKLEDLFGVPVEHFCYPYGDWNERVRDQVAEAGYKSACTTETGINTQGERAYSLKRFTARYRSRNLKNFWAMLTGR